MSTKEKYNNFVQKEFVNCPIHKEEKIFGCVVKHLNRDFNWDKFLNWLKVHEALTPQEINAMKLLGLTTDEGKG